MKPNEMRSQYGLTAGWRYPSSGRLHASWDIPAPIGVPIHSPVDGTVVDCRDGIPNGGGRYPGGPSNWVVIGFDHPTRGRSSFFFQHLSPGLGAKMKKGGKVKKGDYVGKVGLTGNTSGPHLHLTLQEGWTTETQRYRYLSTNGRTAIFPPDYETADPTPVEPPEDPEEVTSDMAMCVYVGDANLLVFENGASTAISKGAGENLAKQGLIRAGVLKADLENLQALSSKIVG